MAKHHRKGGRRKGKALSSAHRKAISTGLKRYWSTGGKRRKRRSARHKKARAGHRHRMAKIRKRHGRKTPGRKRHVRIA